MNHAHSQARSPAVRRARPAPKAATSPRTPVARPQPQPAPVRAPTPIPIVERAPITPANVDFDNIASTNLFDTLGSIRALAPASPNAQIAKSDTPSYSREELFAIAEIAYHYLRCGGYELASVVFEGLASLAPREPYFALALGFSADMLGDTSQAAAHYRRAATLDPTDARADINLAELALASGDRRRAIALLTTAANKAAKKSDTALSNKARAMLALLA